MSDFRVTNKANDYLEFINKYHEETLALKKARRNKDGTPTTVLDRGLEVDGYIATVPFYDRETGRNLTMGEARKKWEPLIRSGEIPVVPADMGVPIENHPANIWPRMNHETQSYDPKKALSAIKYDFYEPPSLGQAPKLKIDHR